MMTLFLQRVRHGLKHRPYLFVALAAGVLLFWLLRWLTPWHWSSCLLLSWNSAAWLYLWHTLHMMWRVMQGTQSNQMMALAQAADESKWVILSVVMVAVLVCLVAIVAQLHLTPSTEQFVRVVHVVLTIATIFSTWLLLHSMFALHYAHDFYLAQHRGLNGGLHFPKTEQPDYFDFLYFSLIIGTSAQTADVELTSRAMRHINMLHCVLAFAFNTVILAIAINVAAGMV